MDLTVVPGDIVTAKYSNNEGKYIKGYFLVLGNQALDNLNDKRHKFFACKITSRNKNVDNYCQVLNKSAVPCLKVNSYAQCDSIYPFIDTQIMEYIGKVSTEVFRNVYKKVQPHLDEMSRQMRKYI